MKFDEPRRLEETRISGGYTLANSFNVVSLRIYIGRGTHHSVQPLHQVYEEQSLNGCADMPLMIEHVETSQHDA